MAEAGSTGSPSERSAPISWLERVLRDDPENRFKEILANPAQYRFQVLVAVPSHSMLGSSSSSSLSRAGGPEEEGVGCRLRRFGFRSGAEYIYPASCVKLAAAMASLAFLREARLKWGVPVRLCSRLAFHRSAEEEEEEEASLEDRDDSNVSGPSPGCITVAHEIRKLCLVSDNAAYNRLLDLVGHSYLDEYLTRRLGLTSARLTHRLHDRVPTRLTDESHSPAVELWYGDEEGFCLPRRTPPPESPRVLRGSGGGRGALMDHAALGRTDAPACVSSAVGQPCSGGGSGHQPAEQILIGQGYIDSGGTKVDEPMDFAPKNYMSLQDLQDLLMILTRPDLLGATTGHQQTDEAASPSCCCPSGLLAGLDEGDRLWLMEAMAQYPGQSSNPRYDSNLYPDDYAKFFLGGICRVWDKRAVRVFNKDGQAYGFSSDNAYIMNTDTGESFFLAASVYTNANGVLNDDCYEYQDAERLMEDLAEVVARALFGVGRS